jgi:hypothetical protein
MGQLLVSTPGSTFVSVEGGLNHEYMAQPGASGGPCGGLEEGEAEPKNRQTTPV